MSLLGKIPGMPTSLALANAIKNTATNARTVNAAMAAEVPQKAAPLTPEQIKLLSRALSVGAASSGSAGALPLR